MEPTSGLFATLALELAKLALKKTVDELPGRLRRLIEGDPEKMAALRRAFQVGLEEALQVMAPPDRDRAERYEGLMKRFLGMPETAEELAKLVDLRNVTADPEAVVNISHLETLFRKAYPVDEAPDAYKGLDFLAVMRAFVRAYSNAIKLQPDKLPWVNTAYLDAMLGQLGLLPRLAEDVQVIRETLTGEEAKEQALQAYLHWVRRRCGYLPLRGVDVGASDPTVQQQRMELAQVYVDLDTTQHAQVDTPLPEALQLEPRRWIQVRRLSALEGVIHSRKLVLLGDPGSGKSTFMNHLALCLASQGLEPDANWLGRLPGWPEDETQVIPIHVTLRDFARWLPKGVKKAKPHLLWDFIVQRLEAEKLETAAEPLCEALESGQAVLLFDGLDEIPTTARRAFIRDAVVVFAERYSSCRALVTCRTLSYGGASWQLPDVPAFELAPFDEEKINRFIGAWYAELGRLGVVRSEDASGLVRRLREAVRRPDLWRLAPNPLLLTVMALVHTHKGRLPEARALLYEETVDILLWRWEQIKVSGEEEMPRLRQLLLEAGRSDVDLKRVLWELAFQAHKEGGAADDEESLADIGELTLVKALAQLHPEEDYGWAQDVVGQMKERAGLLLEREPGIFTLPHRTFQEYLAGACLSAQADFAQRATVLVEEGAFWREVILLAVGRLVYLSGDVAKPLALVGELCPAQRMDDDLSWGKAWLAGDVLVEMGLNRVRDSTLGRDLAERLRQRLADLVSLGRLGPMERTEAGNILAHLGDPRLGVGMDPQTGLPNIVWCEVPAGPFLMGSDKKRDPQAYGDELPQHEVILSAYSIGKYPITNAQFAAFVQAGGYSEPRYWAEAEAAGVWRDGQIQLEWADEIRDRPADFGTPFNLSNHPVVGVTWYEVLAFCCWLTERLRENGQLGPDQEVTLPTEAQWEKAGRGAHGRIYPWGEEPDPNKANYDETGIGATSAVGCFPAGAGPYDILDMSGNVWEWTCSLWGEGVLDPSFGYPYDPSDGQEDLSAGRDVLRVLRGGSWGGSQRGARCALRLRYFPVNRDLGLGFRVAASPGSP
jgi:formylglycine-generating enzyme required for sulfatase activity